ncbi:MAG: SGNH/GDSL hydrolase family protein, partial [Firmicutes bacterium]|nr:SGNH/GDSL hydrolase family protein [Bacillota bacterium]
GAASGGISFADELCKKTGYKMIKEAVSGTTLVDDSSDSYVSRLRKISVDTADLLVCQLSTNDATNKKPLGEVGDGKKINEFDLKTVAGALEYIIAYTKEKWECPVLFYTNPRYNSEEYQRMVELLKKVSHKWNVPVLNLWEDAEFNSHIYGKREEYMADAIHPTLAGYREWWLPYFEKAVKELLG